MIRETFTLLLTTFTPLSMHRVNVHVERQEVRGLSKAECRQYQAEAKKAAGVKAACVVQRTVVVASDGESITR